MNIVFFFFFCSSQIFSSYGTVIPSSSSRPRISSKILTKGNDYFHDDISVEAIPEIFPPQDLCILKDEKYLEYLSKRKYPRHDSIIHSKSKSAKLMKDIRLENWLMVDGGASELDVLIILESPNLYSHQLQNLTLLPLIYLSSHRIALFTAFLKRFRYFSENSLIELHRSSFTPSLLSSPFSYLIQAICQDYNLNHPSIEDFFEIILKTQSTALIPSEIFYFDLFLRLGPSAWKFLKLYFEMIESESMSESLVIVLTGLECEEKIELFHEDLADFVLLSGEI